MRVGVVVALLGASPAHAEVAVDADVGLGLALEPFEQFPLDSSGLVFGLGVGESVAPELRVQARLRAGVFSHRGARWFPIMLGPSATLALGPVWLAGGVSVAYIANDGAHCFRHADGFGGDFALAVGLPITDRVSFALMSAITVIEDGGESHRDVQVMAGLRIALQAARGVYPGN